MLVVTILPILCSTLLIAAHFYRSGSFLLTAVSLLLPLVLFTRSQWAPRLVTLFLLLSAAEWLRTMLVFIEQYQASDISWTRLAIILNSVSVCLHRTFDPDVQNGSDEKKIQPQTTTRAKAIKPPATF